MIGCSTNRYRRFDPRGAALALVLGLGVALASPSAANAQQICAADLNNNGDAADEGEQASCLATTSGAWLCPIQEVDCVADAMGQYSCPVGPPYACLVKSTGGAPSCSPNHCADLATNPLVEEPPMDDPGRKRTAASMPTAIVWGPSRSSQAAACAAVPPDFRPPSPIAARTRAKS